MGNSRRRTINYTPRMSDLEAHDLLHPELKHALETSPFEWSAYAVYLYAKKHTRKETIAWIEGGNVTELRKAWWRGFPNPTALLGMQPIRPCYRAALSSDGGE